MSLVNNEELKNLTNTTNGSINNTNSKSPYRLCL